MFFAILFGLSMDYQVFLVSRMHEEWVHTHDNRRAVTVGQAETGGIITAAAFIMITVCLRLHPRPEPRGEAARPGPGERRVPRRVRAATILVPSLMHIFGKANWFFPKALEKITPHVSIDAEDAAHAQQTGNGNGGARPDEPERGVHPRLAGPTRESRNRGRSGGRRGCAIRLFPNRLSGTALEQGEAESGCRGRPVRGRRLAPTLTAARR